jgi:hypothetical protein
MTGEGEVANASTGQSPLNEVFYLFIDIAGCWLGVYLANTEVVKLVLSLQSTERALTFDLWCSVTSKVSVVLGKFQPPAISSRTSLQCLPNALQMNEDTVPFGMDHADQ